MYFCTLKYYDFRLPSNECDFSSFLSLQKLLNEASDDFLKAVHVAIRCIDDHKKYYEKVTLTLIFLFLGKDIPF